MSNLFALKLQQLGMLSADAKRSLDGLLGRPVRRFGPREDIAREGERVKGLYVISSGWACCYKVLHDGRRQITSVLVPGDLCDFASPGPREIDHSVGTLTSVTAVELPQDVVDAFPVNHPQIAMALRWEAQVVAAIQREWTVSLGQRSACERIAHLLCEFLVRLKNVGLAQSTSYELPVTQAELADITGLTTVHVNRTLRDMRNQGLISIRDRTVTILDWAGLQDTGLFNSNYLYLGQKSRSSGQRLVTTA